MPRPEQPKIPQNLHPYAREVLERLGGSGAARHFILGGGVALSHYCEYRPTVDLDGWWLETVDAQVLETIREAMAAIAARDGFQFGEKAWGEVVSLELSRDNRKHFSVQIALRGHALDAPQPSPWACPIETLRDNLASKMTALVERGAPRDFLDLYQVCTRGLATPGECWEFYAQKHGAKELGEVKLKTLAHLERIEKLRPLETIADAAQRREAAAIRDWHRNVLAKN